ncbi:MAG: hypothetical protein U1E65_35245 [Myxococcota bacterium]
MPTPIFALAAGLLLSQTGTSTGADAPLPFTDAQLDYLEKMRDQIREEMAGSGGGAAPAAAENAPSRLELKAEAYMKWLYRNDATQGCVSYGNPHPTGDNYSGNNGACPEFALTIIGRPMAQIEGGFRLQSRFGMDFADWFENGDKRTKVDASGESLGQNHSAPIQLRGIYVRIAEPLPFLDWFLAGSSDLSYWDPFTVGKVRYIDRFNAKGLFLKTHIPGALDILIARIALPKLFGSANYGSLEEPLVTNPFWARDAVYALQLATPRGLIDGVSMTLNGDVILDEEADKLDPDAPGSTNAVDKPNAVVDTAGRFIGVNASFGLNITRFDSWRLKGTFAFSHNAPNAAYVTNLARGGLGFTNIVNDKVSDVAGVVRLELPNVFGEGRSLKAEYFNIGADFNSVMGARREDDVLLTDGFLDGGELPTLNIANELIDFTDVFYESIVGWHGGTLMFAQEGDLLDASLEGTVITFNTNGQGRDMDIYPGFGGFTGYTDTQLFSYANTNDRGADPRAVYHKDQDRFSAIFAVSATLKPRWWTGAKVEGVAKLILDRDGRNATITEDDYFGRILAARVAISAQPFEPLSATLGFSVDQWAEDARSGTFAGGTARFYGYQTLRLRPYLSFSYNLGPLSARYHIEAVHKGVTVSDPTQSYDVGWVLRSIGWLSAQF